MVVPGVWDIFAGSGGLGLEALSRGAERATFVERGREAAECLAANIEVCRFSAAARLVRADAFRLDFERPEHDAQLVFLDPPFPCFADARADLENLLRRVSTTPRFHPDGLLIWRLPDDAANVAFPAALELTDRRETGRSVIEIYRRRA